MLFIYDPPHTPPPNNGIKIPTVNVVKPNTLYRFTAMLWEYFKLYVVIVQ